MNALITFLFMLPFLLPIVLANFAERERSVRILLFVYLGLLGGLVLLLGVGGLLAGLFFSGGTASETLHRSLPAMADSQIAMLTNAPWLSASLILVASTLSGVLMLLPVLRRVIAKVLPIDPQSAMHTTALMLTMLAIGMNLWQSAILTPFLIDQIAAGEAMQQATYLDVLVFPLLTLTLAALTGVGLYIRRDQSAVLARLGLTLPMPLHLLIAVVTTGVLVGLAIGTEMVWQQLDPEGYKQIGSLSEAMLGNFSGVLGALAIGGSAAIGEEIFFRGAYQPRMGLLLTAALFAIFHVQYGFSPATLLVFTIGLVLGVLRQRTSLTVCMMVHFMYNATLVLMGS